jgi:cyclase
MLTKRIIPCLDIKDGKVVKGVNFNSLRLAGDPIRLAKIYDSQGADEIVFLDISATKEKRKTTKELVRKIAKQIFIPLTVGGGISCIGDIREILNAGADKVCINTAAVKNPKLIRASSKVFGSQCIVVAIDAKKINRQWRVFIESGTKNTGFDAIEWAKKVCRLGAGEILLTSIDRDGTKQGYDLELTRKVSQTINIPVIASGGANDLESLCEVFQKGSADAVLAASIFHYKKYDIKTVKDYLKSKGITVRK